MDDIIVSADELDLVTDASATLKEAADRSRLPLHAEKQEGPAVEVTSFNITLSHGELRITNARLQRFATAYAFSTNKDQRAGILSYVTSVNSEQAKLIAGSAQGEISR
jgi:hypothetical protein